MGIIDPETEFDFLEAEPRFAATGNAYDYAVSDDAVTWKEAERVAQLTAGREDCLTGVVPECPRSYRTTQTTVYDRFVEDELGKRMASRKVDRVWVASWAEIKNNRPDESTRISPAVLVRNASGAWKAEKPRNDEKAHVGVALYHKRAQLKGTPDPSIAHRVTPDYHGSKTGYTKADGQKDYGREGL